MITFVKEGKNVSVKIEHGIFYGDAHFSVQIIQSYEFQAELLKRALQEKMNIEISKIKRNAYNQGWKEAKAKSKKKQYDDFFGGWDK